MTEIYTRLNIVMEIKSLQIKLGFLYPLFFFLCVCRPCTFVKMMIKCTNFSHFGGFPSKILTSVRATIITVTSMLSAIILRVLIIAPVSLDTLEMEAIARVMTCFILSLFIDI